MLHYRANSEASKVQNVFEVPMLLPNRVGFQEGKRGDGGMSFRCCGTICSDLHFILFSVPGAAADRRKSVIPNI